MWIEKLKAEALASPDGKASCNFGLPNQVIKVKCHHGGHIVNPMYFWYYNEFMIKEPEAQQLLDRMQRESYEILAYALQDIDLD